MTTLLLISVLITVLYVGTTIYIHKELPASVSHMVFNLPRNYQFLWTLFIWSVAFGTVPALLDAMEGSIFQFVGFLFIASLAFIGAMPLSGLVCWGDYAAMASDTFLGANMDRMAVFHVVEQHWGTAGMAVFAVAA